MDRSRLQLVNRAETLLCLARAFLPPRDEADFSAMRDALGPDLRELDAELPLADTPQLTALCDTLAALPDHTRLLTSYSRLFLAPPAPALLNLGFYLDGGVMGGTCQTIERLYAEHGLERDAHFKDTADHLALYLQFLGWSLARAEEALEAGDEAAARKVLTDLHQSIVQHGLPALGKLIAQIDKAEREFPVARIYSQLARLAESALERDAHAIQLLLPRKPTLLDGGLSAANPTTLSGDADTGPEIGCAACGTSFVAGKELASMIAVLETQGLSTDHMKVCPDCRAGVMGMTALAPPKLKKAS